MITISTSNITFLKGGQHHENGWSRWQEYAKGSRKVAFGHKINLSSGKSNLILSCDTLEGNPSDKTLYQKTVDKIIADYGTVPRDSATDGGYASKDNMEYAKQQGIVNIVFNKIVGSLKNVTSSLGMETRLKK